MINKIKKMDVKSEEFFEIYKVVSEKYWTFENSDELQKCSAMLVRFAERGDECEIIAATKIIIELFKMKQENSGAGKLAIGFTDGTEYRIDIYKDGIEKESLEELAEKGLKALESGTATITHNGKRKKFGKDYSKKKK